MGNMTIKKNATSTELTDKEIAMLKSTTNNSEEQIRQWHKNFQKICPTGKLNKEKFIILFRALNKNKKDDLYERIFDAFDVNQDGTMDFNELLLAIAATSKSGLDKELEFVFEMCDVSGDGLIDLNELTKWISNAFELNNESNLESTLNARHIAETVFDKFSVDKDKKITKQQFVDGCKQNSSLRRIFTEKK